MANMAASEDIDDISTYTARITEFDIKNELVPLRQKQEDLKRRNNSLFSNGIDDL